MPPQPTITGSGVVLPGVLKIILSAYRQPVCGSLGTLNRALKGNSRRLTAADAQHCNTPLFVLVFHGVGQSHDKRCRSSLSGGPGRKRRLHIGPCWVQTELLGSQHGDHGKRLIYFEQIDAGPSQSSPRAFEWHR